MYNLIDLGAVWARNLTGGRHYVGAPLHTGADGSSVKIIVKMPGKAHFSIAIDLQHAPPELTEALSELGRYYYDRADDVASYQPALIGTDDGVASAGIITVDWPSITPGKVKPCACVSYLSTDHTLLDKLEGICERLAK